MVGGRTADTAEGKGHAPFGPIIAAKRSISASAGILLAETVIVNSTVSFDRQHLLYLREVNGAERDEIMKMNLKNLLIGLISLLLIAVIGLAWSSWSALKSENDNLVDITGNWLPSVVVTNALNTATSDFRIAGGRPHPVDLSGGDDEGGSRHGGADPRPSATATPLREADLPRTTSGSSTSSSRPSGTRTYASTTCCSRSPARTATRRRARSSGRCDRGSTRRPRICCSSSN